MRQPRVCSPVVDRLSGEQGWRCCYCGCRMVRPRENYGASNNLRARAAFRNMTGQTFFGPARDGRLATREHIIPRSRGGTNAWENLVAACSWCNTFRGNLPFEIALIAIARLVQRGTHPHQVFDTTGYWPKPRAFVKPRQPYPPQTETGATP